MKKYYSLFIIAFAFLFSSCEKDDTAVVLPPPGDVEQAIAVLGANYDFQAYVDLDNHSVITRNNVKTYDLAFEASADGKRIYLNGAKVMLATGSSSGEISSADTIGKIWRPDQEQYNPDSTAIGNWWNVPSALNSTSEVFIIDRGSSIPSADRFRKLQIISVSAEKYSIRFSKYNNSDLTVMDIPKDSAYALMYLSFDDGGKLVQQAPPKDQWDFVFTRYTHVYFEEPPNSVFRNYTVTGALLNVWTGTQGTIAKKDSTADYVAFNDCNYNKAGSWLLTPNANVIGYDWKYYDFNNSRYYIVPDVYFIVKNSNGIYYKLRMLDYYDAQGNKGTVTFQYQRL